MQHKKFVNLETIAKLNYSLADLFSRGVREQTVATKLVLVAVLIS
jgi:hypothetical protein